MKLIRLFNCSIKGAPILSPWKTFVIWVHIGSTTQVNSGYFFLSELNKKMSLTPHFEINYVFEKHNLFNLANGSPGLFVVSFFHFLVHSRLFLFLKSSKNAVKLQNNMLFHSKENCIKVNGAERNGMDSTKLLSLYCNSNDFNWKYCFVLESFDCVWSECFVLLRTGCFQWKPFTL